MRDDIGAASDEQADDNASDNTYSQAKEGARDDCPDSQAPECEIIPERPRNCSNQHARKGTTKRSSNCSIEQ
jgi:hypothetical protein